MKITRDLSAIIAAGSNFDFIDEVVPTNCHYVIKAFGNDLSNVAAWGLVHWRFLENGVPMFPMDDIFDQMGFAAQRQSTQPLVIRGGGRFQLRGIADAGTPVGTRVLVSIEFDIEPND